MAKNLRFTNFLPIWWTIFLDFLGLAIVVPIFAPLLFDTDAGILPAATSLTARGTILGFLSGVFPLASFFAAPILGKLSDKHGRKPILLISLAIAIIGYLVSAFAISGNSIFWIFVGRILCGLAGGNVSIAQSAVADRTEDALKATYFGYLTLAMGLGFTLGPALGGRLADPAIVSWFNFATPFWLSAILALTNWLAVAFFFRETLTTKGEGKIQFVVTLHEAGKIFKLPGVRVLFIIFFLFVTAWMFFAQFFQVYLIQKFHFNQLQIGDTYTFVGICYAIAQGLIVAPLSRRVHARYLVSGALFILIFAYLALLIPKNPKYLFTIFPFLSLFIALGWPNIIAMLSNLTDKQRQGEVLGISQAIQALAQAVAPIVAGPLVAVDVHLPTLISAGCVALAWMILWIDWKHLTPKEKTNDL